MKQTAISTFSFLFLQTCDTLLTTFLAEKFPFVSLELECAMELIIRICQPFAPSFLSYFTQRKQKALKCCLHNAGLLQAS